MNPVAKKDGDDREPTSPIISCHSSKQSAFFLLRDTQLRGRELCILNELEGAFTVTQSTPFILQVTEHRPRAVERPAQGNMRISSWRMPSSVWPCLTLGPGFPSQGQDPPAQIQLLNALSPPSAQNSFLPANTNPRLSPSLGTGPFYL